VIKKLILPVILSGGSGARLWPLSRLGLPKQFLTLPGCKLSLYQQAIQRLSKLSDHNSLHKILIIANEEHRFLALDQLSDLDADKCEFFLEPEGRNTAPAMTIAALYAIEKNEDPILLVVPSDQIIHDEKAFLECLRKGIDVASEGSMVVFGIKPDRPETGFGYIKTTHEEGIHDVLSVIEFREKPNLNLAKEYFNSGEYFWNSGIFVMKASVWLNAIEKCRPDILMATQKAFNQRTIDKKFIRPNLDLFNKIPSESIDYAVMEKLSGLHNIKLISLNAGWNDLGSWDAFWQMGTKDDRGNVFYGDTLTSDTNNSLIYANERLVVTHGIKDLIIIETIDSVLIIDKNQTQIVKDIVNKLALQNREERNLHRKVLRPWGWFDTLDEGRGFKVKRIQVNPGASLSLQRHSKRAEHWVVVKGIAEIICEDKKIILNENESTFIPLGSKHQLSNPGNDTLEIIEVQSGSYLGEDDIERLEDNYGRIDLG